MDINMQKRNEVLAQNVIKGLESRNMSGYYSADREAAVCTCNIWRHISVTGSKR